MLAITLRYLAGGSRYDLARNWGVSLTCVKKIIRRTIDMLFQVLEMPQFPVNDVAALRDLASGFANKSDERVFEHCVGALDGWVPYINKPTDEDVDGLVSRYYYRKGFYGINVQAICDSNLRFTHISIATPGSAHDTTAWHNSDLYQKILTAGVKGKDCLCWCHVFKLVCCISHPLHCLSVTTHRGTS